MSAVSLDPIIRRRMHLLLISHFHFISFSLSPPPPTPPSRPLFLFPSPAHPRLQLDPKQAADEAIYKANLARVDALTKTLRQAQARAVILGRDAPYMHEPQCHLPQRKLQPPEWKRGDAEDGPPAKVPKMHSGPGVLTAPTLKLNVNASLPLST